ncbi:MAG: LysM peptidoglycan-binding domain-containing protein [Acidobacteriota bacterium]
MKIRIGVATVIFLGFAFVLIAPLLFAGSIHEHPPKPHFPPKHGKWVRGHWTPWEPPEPAEGAYIIQPGDTLWDLAQEFLGDPFLWPQIWEENKYILDSHWIYPGDPLVIPAKPIVVPKEEEKPPAVAERPEVPPAPPEKEVPPAPPAPALYPVASMTDMYCSGYIERSHQASDMKIAGREEVKKEGLAEGDIVYINRGHADGIKGGDKFFVIKESREIKHPKQRKLYGVEIVRLGTIQVIAVQDKTATAQIIFSCSDINTGNELLPYHEIPIPMTEGSTFDRWQTEFSGKPTGFIIDTKDGIESTGEGHIIYIDLGDNAGVKPGDYLRIYRPNSDGKDLPRIMLGEMVVLTVQPENSTGKIVSSVKEVMRGDLVELK